ncbi:hypothetical protein [Spirosoma aerolatum]|uniref:hypothetical protein n=1 Tax=Spirosoma aerolatum TaxID=1211326 RepID=UPI0009ABC9C2|nr:hypothetical protein [Spirosoma aerolatum]
MATISTKFEVGQKVYFLNEGKVSSDEIDFINISIKQWRLEGDKDLRDVIEYALKNHYKERHRPILHKESILYATAQELADSVLKQAELI